MQPEKGMPSAPDVERFVLGSILLNDAFYIQAAGQIEADDFSLEKHRRIFKRMGDLQERGEQIDRVTVTNELMRFNELEACDGFGYMASLDEGLPMAPNIDGYVRIVKDKSTLRRLIFLSQNTMNRCLLGETSPAAIIESAGMDLLGIGDRVTGGDGPATAQQIIDDFEGGIEAFLDPSKEGEGHPDRIP